MINWPEMLVKDIAKRKCVLFLGAGVSSNAKSEQGKHPATWEEFLKDVTDKRKDKISSHMDILMNLIKKQDYLTACEIIVDTIGENDFAELIADEYRRPGYKPSKIHEIIYGLDSRIVITPNVDKIYEQYALAESNSSVVVKSYYEEDLAKYLRSDDFLIIRAHGYVDESSKAIFTHRQYAEARNKYSSFYKLLDALILTHTFVFIGCGINDPDIQLILENATFLYPDCRQHYFITSDDSISPEIQESLGKNRNLEMITYKNPDGMHSHLIAELCELQERVEEEREAVAMQIPW